MNIIVVGSGIVGLTSAITLKRAGHNVAVFYADDPRPVSEVAAAFWYPYCVKIDGYSERELAEPGLHQFLRDALNSEETGVTIEHGYEIFDTLTDQSKRKDPWWRDEDGVFWERLNDDDLLQLPYDPAVFGGIPSAVRVSLPVIRMSKYLGYLRSLCEENLGIKLIQRKVDCLSECATDDVDAIINCSGLGARSLANDTELVPKLGHIAVFKTNDNGRPKVDFLFVQHGLFADTPLYIVPRGDHDVLVGGTVISLPDASEAELTKYLSKDNCDPIARLVARRAQRFDRRLKQQQPVEFDCGLRPYRSPFRLDEDLPLGDGVRLIHNYGHGGGGVTLSWGCAQIVKSLLESPSRAISSTAVTAVSNATRDPYQKKDVCDRDEYHQFDRKERDARWDKRIAWALRCYSPDVKLLSERKIDIPFTEDELRRLSLSDKFRVRYDNAIGLVKHDDQLNWNKFNYMMAVQAALLVGWSALFTKGPSTGESTFVMWIISIIGIWSARLATATMREGMRCLLMHRRKVDVLDELIFPRTTDCEPRRFMFCDNAYNSREALRWTGPVFFGWWLIQFIICGAELIWRGAVSLGTHIGPIIP